MKKIIVVLAVLFMTSAIIASDGWQTKYLVPVQSDSSWFDPMERDTIIILWDQPFETDINHYDFYFTEVPDSVFGDSLALDSDYSEKIRTWETVDYEGIVKWSYKLGLTVPVGYYMCQLTATDNAVNESYPSSPVFLKPGKSGYYYQPKGLMIIIKRYE